MPLHLVVDMPAIRALPLFGRRLPLLISEHIDDVHRGVIIKRETHSILQQRTPSAVARTKNLFPVNLP